MRAFIPASPFSASLGMALDHIEDGCARIRMPYDTSRTTYADIVHGGAIAALVDVAVMAPAWAGASLPEQLRGVTVSLSTQFVDVARAEDLLAEGPRRPPRAHADLGRGRRPRRRRPDGREGAGHLQDRLTEDSAMLEMRPGCERCDTDLPPGSTEAMICSFECTFCRPCAADILGGVCPNCAGPLVARPVRPDALLARFPGATERTYNPQHRGSGPETAQRR